MGLNIWKRGRSRWCFRHLGAKYAPIVVDRREIRKLLAVQHKRMGSGAGDALRAPITADELRLALFRGRRDTAPGKDGIGVVSYTQMWDSLDCDIHKIFTKMFLDKEMTAGQKEGIIVCIPKKASPLYPHDYRPITLLNNDYKTLARLIAHRLSGPLEEILHPSQHCGVRGKTIFDAVGTVRDVIAYAEVTRKPLCVVSLDFTEALDCPMNTSLRQSKTTVWMIIPSNCFVPCILMYHRWCRSTETYLRSFLSVAGSGRDFQIMLLFALMSRPPVVLAGLLSAWYPDQTGTTGGCNSIC
jgi:hypothetical protein